jgi:hypothetical protein
LIIPNNWSPAHNIKEKDSKQNDLDMDILLGIVDEKKGQEKMSKKPILKN